MSGSITGTTGGMMGGPGLNTQGMTGGQFGLPPQVLQAILQKLQMQQGGAMPGGAPGGAPPGGAPGGMPGAPPGPPGAVPGPMGGPPGMMPGMPPQMGPAPPGGGAGPMPGMPPGAAPQPGPTPAGGGVGPTSMQGATGQVPMGGQGVPAMGPRRFSGVPVPPGASRAPGGQNAPGGATPFSIHPQAHQPSMTAAQMGSAGRYGDSVVAHLSPGEVQVPPEILESNPALKSMIQDAFRRTGADISNFTAGSPTTSKNPITGAEENSLWSVLLPIVGAALGSFVGMPAIGMAAGGALGGAAGGAIDKASPMQMLMQAGLGGLGGYIGGSGGLGSLFGSGADAATSGAGSAASGASGAAGAAGGLPVPPIPPVGELPYPGALPVDPSVASTWPVSSAPSFLTRLGQGLWAGGGSTLGSMLAPQNGTNTSSNNDPNWNNPNAGFSNKTPGQLLGSYSSRYPSFTGYNPYLAATQGGYNFFPQTA